MGEGQALQGPWLDPRLCLCVRTRVLSCSRFDFEGLESADDGAFDKLRAWSRSIEDLQPPSALSAPFTNSLARSARQSVLRYVCALLCPPPPALARAAPGWPTQRECSRTSLHSCFQAQLSCPLPASLSLVCLSVSLTLPSSLSWVSTWPSAVPTPPGVPALPSSPPLRGPLHSSLSLCPSSRASQVGVADPAPSLRSSLCHQLLQDQPPAHLPALPCPALPIPSLQAFPLQGCGIWRQTGRKSSQSAFCPAGLPRVPAPSPCSLAAAPFSSSLWVWSSDTAIILTL